MHDATPDSTWLKGDVRCLRKIFVADDQQSRLIRFGLPVACGSSEMSKVFALKDITHIVKTKRQVPAGKALAANRLSLSATFRGGRHQPDSIATLNIN
jgi:hypothetical protein